MDSPKYHLGHMLMEGLMRNPEYLYQIDAGTGARRTMAEARARGVQLARCLRRCGLRPGDVLALSGTNHIDLNTPFNAALLNGHPIAAVDPQFKYKEIEAVLKITRPKIVFCLPEAQAQYAAAVRALALDARVLSYGPGDATLAGFVQEFDDGQPDDDFQVAEFDLDKVYAFLTCTSGTTGRVKVAAVKHKDVLTKIMVLVHFMRGYSVNSNLNDIILSLGCVSWVINYMSAVMMPFINKCLLTTSKPATADHVIEMINEYRPITASFSVTLASELLERADKVDLTCFTYVGVGGDRCPPQVIARLKSHMAEDCVVVNLYGLTETLGAVMAPVDEPPGSCGVAGQLLELKLVDPATEMEIKESNVPGELWCKGLCFTEYYNDPEETAKCKRGDGWLRTGDLLYRDARGRYFYVDRIKHLIIYRNFNVLTSEIEDVIRSLAGVRDVCVVGVRSAADGELPAACVLANGPVSARQIKDAVADKLANPNQLRGGVVFLDEFPMTSNGKIRKNELVKIAEQSFRESLN